MTDTNTGGLAGSRHTSKAVADRAALRKPRQPTPDVLDPEQAKADSIMNGELPAPEGFVGSAASNSRWSPEAVAARQRLADQYRSNRVISSVQLDESEEVHVDENGIQIIGKPGGWGRLVRRSFAAQGGNPMSGDEFTDYGPSYDPDDQQHEDQLLGETQTVAKMPTTGPTVGQAMTPRRFA